MARPTARAWVAGGLVLCGLLVQPASAHGAVRPAPPLDTVVVEDGGPGYTVISQGPLDVSGFASSSPNPSAASRTFATLAKTARTYERVWRDSGGANQVQDLVVRFPSPVGAQLFLQAAQHSLESGEVVSSGPLPGIPGARRTTYLSPSAQAGVGQVVTMRAGIYVGLLSFLSAASGNAHPITPAEAVRVAQAQHRALVAAPGGSHAPLSSGSSKGLSAGSIGVAALVVAVLAIAVATPTLLGRRRGRNDSLGRHRSAV